MSLLVRVFIIKQCVENTLNYSRQTLSTPKNNTLIYFYNSVLVVEHRHQGHGHVGLERHRVVAEFALHLVSSLFRFMHLSLVPPQITGIPKLFATDFALEMHDPQTVLGKFSDPDL